ncbi:MAG: C-terminal binding protein, partial [Spirochaetota bacterium]
MMSGQSENNNWYTVVNLDPHLHPSIGRMQLILHNAHALLTEKKCTTEEEVIDFAVEADAVIAAQAPVTSKVIDKLKQCRVIGRLGAGTDNVDHEAATRHNIVVVYVPDFCTEEVANHALMLILACNKKLKQLDNFVRRGGWGFELAAPIPAIKDQILGLIGFGRIARNLAKKAVFLGMKVIAFDPYVSPEVFEENHSSRGTLEEILKESDYISLHIPLNKETANFIGVKQLKMMKSTAYLINCARGAVVDENALFDILRQHLIAGAALDCLKV